MTTAHTLAKPAPVMGQPSGWKSFALRPDYTTFRPRADLRMRPMALAAHDARCTCGSEVLAHEPIVCVGAYLVANEDGTRTVDLSGCEWRCQRCVTIFQPGGRH